MIFFNWEGMTSVIYTKNQLKIFRFRINEIYLSGITNADLTGP